MASEFGPFWCEWLVEGGKVKGAVGEDVEQGEKGDAENEEVGKQAL